MCLCAWGALTEAKGGLGTENGRIEQNDSEKSKSRRARQRLACGAFGGDDGRGLWDALGECRRYLLAFVKWTAVGLLSGAAAGIAALRFIGALMR